MLLMLNGAREIQASLLQQLNVIFYY